MFVGGRLAGAARAITGSSVKRRLAEHLQQVEEELEAECCAQDVVLEELQERTRFGEVQCSALREETNSFHALEERASLWDEERNQLRHAVALEEEAVVVAEGQANRCEERARSYRTDLELCTELRLHDAATASVAKSEALFHREVLDQRLMFYREELQVVSEQLDRAEARRGDADRLREIVSEQRFALRERDFALRVFHDELMDTTVAYRRVMAQLVEHAAELPEFYSSQLGLGVGDIDSGARDRASPDTAISEMGPECGARLTVSEHPLCSSSSEGQPRVDRNLSLQFQVDQVARLERSSSAYARPKRRSRVAKGSISPVRAIGRRTRDDASHGRAPEGQNVRANERECAEVHTMSSTCQRLDEEVERDQSHVLELEAELAEARRVRCASAEEHACHLNLFHVEAREVAELRAALDTARTEVSESDSSLVSVTAEATRLRGLSSLQTGLATLTPEELSHATEGFIESLGAGSYGRVFGGRLEWGHIAVKMPASRGSEEQFVRELRAGGIQDPHLVHVVAVCLELRALIYPRASATLEDRLRSTSPGPAEGLRLLLGASRGLLALHDRGLVHRDVKSSNILIFETTARLGDCGWVGPEGEARVSGTLSNMDPVALASGVYTKGADVFSLGVSMLEVLLRRSVTTLDQDRPLWRQLNEALPLACNGAGALTAAAVAFVLGSGVAGWQAEPLAAFAGLVVETLKENLTQERSIDRPPASGVVARLSHAEVLQATHIETIAPVEAYRLCSICFENLIDTRFWPCCHSLACQSCAPLFDGGLCPYCRESVVRFDRGQFDSTFVPLTR